MPVSKQPTPNHLEGPRRRVDLPGNVASKNPNGADSP